MLCTAPDCDPPPLTNSDLLTIAGDLTKGLTRRACQLPSEETRKGAAALAHETGLSGFFIHGHRVASMSSDVSAGHIPAIEFDFETQGVRRSFTFYASAAEGMNLTRILGGRAVTTLVHVGAGEHGVRRTICQDDVQDATGHTHTHAMSHGYHLHHTFRLITGAHAVEEAEAEAEAKAEAKAEAPKCGPLRQRGVQSLGCACAHTQRSAPCYDLATFS